MKTKLILCAIALGCGGCGSAYTSIRPLEDGSYLLTENAAGFIRTSGHVYRCTGDDTRLVCKETGAE